MAKRKQKIHKVIKLEIELVKNNNANNHEKLKNELKKLNKNNVSSKNLHESKNEMLLDNDGLFEMDGAIIIGDANRRTYIKFGNINDFESNNNSIGEGYETEYITLIGHIHKIDTPVFNMINRAKYGNGCDFKHQIIEYNGNNCYIPTKSYCYIECFNYSTGLDYRHFSKLSELKKSEIIL